MSSSPLPPPFRQNWTQMAFICIVLSVLKPRIVNIFPGHEAFFEDIISLTV